MGNDKLRRLIEEVTKDLSPSRLEFRVQNEDVLHILIVSELFAGMPLSKRFERLSQIFETRSAHLATEFTLVFQAWTRAEIQNLEDESGENNSGDKELPRKKAARQPEL